MNGTGPMRYLFRLDPESKYLQLREKLSELCGTPANQIAFMDVGGGVVRVGGVPFSTSIRSNSCSKVIHNEVNLANLTIECSERDSVRVQ